MKKKLLGVALLSAVLTLGVTACNAGESSVPPATSSIPSSEQSSETSSVQPSVSSVESSEESSSESSTIPEADPVITLTSEEAVTVVAGVEVALPTATATDYDGTDLTASIEIEDDMDSGTILEGGAKFKSNIAGEHTLNYYVESTTGRYTEKNLTVNVTPVTAENFDTTGYQDPAAFATYGTLKENFAAGKKNKLGISAPTGCVSYSATSEAIAGNSMIIDVNKTAGSAANQVFMNAFNDYFQKGKQASYILEFDYKFLTNNGNTGDVYASISWDGTDGLNVNGLNADGAVHHFYHKWAQVELPVGANVWFSIWKLGVSDLDAIMAVDNFVITAQESAQVTPYTPTAAELEEGFTWNLEDKGITSTNGEVVLVNNIENNDIKTALAGNENFGNNALHLTGADDHKFSGLTADNLTAGKQLKLSMVYYKVNNGGFHLIMMQNGGITLDKYVTVTDLGDNFVKVELDYKLPTGCYQLNVYGQGNNAFEIYVAGMTAKLEEPEPEVDPKATVITNFYGMDNGNTAAHSWDAETRKATVNTPDGDSTLWLTIDASDMLKAGKKYIYKVTFTFDEGFTGTKICMRYASSRFDDILTDFSAGAHDLTLEASLDADGGFFGIYFLHCVGTVKVSSFQIIPNTKVTLDSFYGMDNGNTAAHSWDADTKTATINTPDGDATLWLSISAGNILKAGKTYIVKFTINYAAGFTGDKACLRYDSNRFDDFEFDFEEGANDYEIEVAMTSDGGFWGIYFLHCVGSCTVSSVVIEEDTSYKLTSFYGMDNGNTAAHTWNSDTRTATMDVADGDATLWLSIGAGEFLKAGKTYSVKFTINYAAGFTGDKACLRYASSRFDDFETEFKEGETQYDITVEMDADGGFWGIYFLHCVGSCTVSEVKIAEK